MEEQNRTSHDVQIAVIGEQVKNLGSRIETLTSVVQEFISVSDRKIDKELYLEDRKHTARIMETIERRLTVLENGQENARVAQDARKAEKDRILGLTKGTWLVIIQIVTFVSVIMAIGSRAS